MYFKPVSDFEVLNQRAENARQEVCVKPGIFGKVCTSLRGGADKFDVQVTVHREKFL